MKMRGTPWHATWKAQQRVLDRLAGGRAPEGWFEKLGEETLKQRDGGAAPHVGEKLRKQLAEATLLSKGDEPNGEESRRPGKRRRRDRVPAASFATSVAHGHCEH